VAVAAVDAAAARVLHKAVDRVAVRVPLPVAAVVDSVARQLQQFLLPRHLLATGWSISKWMQKGLAT
jgi:hypothetical protein